MKAVKFIDPLYEARVCYLIGGTVPEMLKYLKKAHGVYEPYSWDQKFEWGEDAGTTDGYQFHINAPLGDGEIFYVWVSKASPSLLFHETLHLVGDILHTRGINYSCDSEEAFAYLGGWIFDKIYKSVRISKDS